MAPTPEHGGVVEEFLCERREEVEQDSAQELPAMSREQFDARLKMLRERTLRRQADRGASKQAQAA